MRLRVGWAALASLLVLSTAGNGDAETRKRAELGGDAEKPWATGVSKKARAKAQALYLEGNERFKADRHADALKLYEKALAHWKHPRILINAATSCLELEQPLRAAKHIDKARLYRRALKKGDRKKLDEVVGEINGQTGTIRIDTNQKGALVAIDGKQVLVGPGSTVHRVLPGSHELVVRRPGLKAEIQTLDVGAGEQVGASPVLFATRTEWRYAPWMPWTVAAAGVLVAGGGGGLMLTARQKRDESNQYVLDECPCSGGKAVIRDQLKRSADQREQLAIGVLAGGGLIAVVGLTLAIMNKPRTVKRAAEDGEVQAGMWIEPDGAGATVSIRF